MAIAIILLLLCNSSDSIAAVHFVFPDQSIQAAVDGAANGDTIVIHDGSYRETTVLYGKRLTIGSLFLLDGDTSHIASTIISPDSIRPDSMSCFIYANGEDVGGRLVGLSLIEGRGTYWSIPDSSAGGAVFVFDAAVSIEHCRFNHCSASHGGGVAAVFDDDFIESNVIIRDCDFRNCYCDYWGGAVYAAFCSLQVVNCVFDSNTCGALGAGAWIMFSVALVDSCIYTNGLGFAGGLSLWDSRVGNVSNCEFSFNRVYDGAGDGNCDLEFFRVGGAVTRCIFSNNLSPLHSVALEGNSQRPVRFWGNVIEHNQTGVSTGTVLISNSPSGEVAYNVFRENLNMSGGAVYCYSDTDVRIHHNVFTENSSLRQTEGAAIKIVSQSNPQIDSNIIDGNFGPVISQFHTQNPQIDARNNWWGDTSGPYHPTANPGGLGDTLLSDSVLFVPWLLSPPDTTFLHTRGRARLVPRTTTWQLLALYPNPFNSELAMDIAGFAHNDFRVTLHNLLGQEISTLFSGPVNGGRINLSVPSGLASGIYFVRLADSHVAHFRKVVFLK